LKTLATRFTSEALNIISPSFFDGLIGGTVFTGHKKIHSKNCSTNIKNKFNINDAPF